MKWDETKLLLGICFIGMTFILGNLVYAQCKDFNLADIEVGKGEQQYAFSLTEEEQVGGGCGD